MDMIPARGRPALSLLLEVDRELTIQDLVNMATNPPPKVGPPMIQKITSIHHEIAACLARGMSDVEISVKVGRTPQRIHDLKIDPSFKDLMAFYQDQKTDKEIEHGGRVRTLLLDNAEIASMEISDRLNNPNIVKDIPIGELRQIAAHGFDRTVAPPKTAVPIQQVPTQITFNMGTRDIQIEAQKIGETNLMIEHEEKEGEGVP